MDVKHHKSGHITRPTVDIPPRKVLSSINSPSSASSPLSKNYSYNSDSEDPYARDHFRMYEFKIRQCTRSRSHDWTDCPFSHPGEKARRRDPLRFHYTGEVCPQFSRHGGYCSRGDECGFAHGVFECWLHPSRYRTEACKDGKHCKRKVCFFAHSPRQLRVLPPSLGFGCETTSLSPASVVRNKNNNRCCLFCSHSPTSTLSGLSRSPPAFSRLSHRHTAALNELISSFDSVSLTETLADSSSQFVLSPSSTPSYVRSQIQFPPASFFSDEFTPRGGRLSDFTAAATAAAEARDKNGFEVGSSGDLDLGWVNDLLT